MSLQNIQKIKLNYAYIFFKKCYGPMWTVIRPWERGMYPNPKLRAPSQLEMLLPMEERDEMINQSSFSLHFFQDKFFPFLKWPGTGNF